MYIIMGIKLNVNFSLFIPKVEEYLLNIFLTIQYCHNTDFKIV